MDLIDELEEATSRGGSSKSRIEQIINGILKPAEDKPGLDEYERKELHDLVMNRRFGTAAIQRVLNTRGYEIGESSVRRYRQKHGLHN